MHWGILTVETVVCTSESPLALNYDVEPSSYLFCTTCRVRGGFDRFYCGAPLVASNGHRLGTMCLGNSQPKTLTAHQVLTCTLAHAKLAS